MMPEKWFHLCGLQKKSTLQDHWYRKKKLAELKIEGKSKSPSPLCNHEKQWRILVSFKHDKWPFSILV